MGVVIEEHRFWFIHVLIDLGEFIVYCISIYTDVMDTVYFLFFKYVAN